MEKQFLIFCCTLIFLSACKQNKPKDFLTIEGEIIGERIDSVHIEKKAYDQDFSKYAIPVSERGTFKDTLNLSSGYYQYIVNGNRYDIYLEPNFDLKIYLNLDLDTLFFKGAGERENNYLLSKMNLRKETFHVDYYGYHAKLDENQFLKTNDSIRALYLRLLEESRIQNKNFEDLEKKSILVDKVYNLMGYEIEKRLLTEQKDFEVSDSFPNPEELLDFNDESFLKIPMFIPPLANNFYYFLKDEVTIDTSSDILKCVDCDLFIEYLYRLGNVLENEKIRNEALFLASKWMMVKTENIDEFYGIYKSINTDQDNLKYVAKIYENLKTDQGRDFLLSVTINNPYGNSLTLKEYEGKYIYLDFWSSSCAPCIKEFPYFNELAQELEGKNIEFIGINVLDTKERWLEMVQKKDLQGVQLAVDKNMDFLDSLGINGLPRYMVLDDAGNILDFNAKRPSDAEIKTELQSLILNTY